jgi:glycosyltransferase involved in cell wall biosynthesis
LFYGTLAAKLGKVKKVIYTEHGRTEKLSRKTRLAHRLLSRYVNHPVIVAKYLGDVLAAEGFDQNKIRLIQNGIDGKSYETPHVRFKLHKELGLGAENRLIGNVARLDPIKNHSLLLHAMQVVLKNKPRARLVLVGDGPLREQLEREAAGLGIEDAVFFLGERNDIAAILRDIDIFVLSSLSEGMSLTLVEAMAARTPIVATDVGGNPALITSGESGLLVPSADPAALASAILKILGDPNLAKSLAGAARHRFEEDFNLETMIERYMELYES